MEYKDRASSKNQIDVNMAEQYALGETGGIPTVIYQTSAWRFRANLIEQTNDFVAVEQVFFGTDYDWTALKAEKLQIDRVDIEVKPAYNFANMAAYGQGVVTSDFPVYMNFFMTNTAGEKDLIKNWAEYLSGKTAMGYATTGVKSTFNGNYFKTVFDVKSLAEDKTEISQKETIQKSTVDNWSLQGKNIVLQKGRIVVYVKLSDFKLAEGHCLTKGNAPLPGEKSPDSGSDGSDQGATRHDLLKYLRKKGGLPEPEEPESTVVKGRKETGRKAKRTQNPNPEPEPTPDTPAQPTTKFVEGWIEDVAVDAEGKQSLILDYVFWVKSIFSIKYWRGASN